MLEPQLLKPLLNAGQTQDWDKATIQQLGISSWQLMEQAAAAFTKWFSKKFKNKSSVAVVCGTGNNGGDGLAVARMLLSQAYTVSVYVVGNPDKGSSDFKINLEKLNQSVTKLEQAPEFGEDIIIDAIFGTGLSRVPEGIFANVIHEINNSLATVISIDLPSGLYADKAPSQGQAIVRASHTVSFQLPKLSFLLPSTGEYVNNWHKVNIGLSKHFFFKQTTRYYYITSGFIAKNSIQRKKWSHKGSHGKALLIAGSYGKMGACVLSAQACLRAGIGLLSLHIPRLGYQIVQTAVPEAMAEPDTDARCFSELPANLINYSVLALGPGLGTSSKSVAAMRTTLEVWNKPLVIDADGLNILSKNTELLKLLPTNTILTPHPLEFARLAGASDNDFERLLKQQEYSKKHQIVLVVKGAHTCITLPDGTTYFNSTGNPALATGGTGDVLTGIILALLGQGHPPHMAAIAGVYIGGLASDLWAKKNGQRGMTASDLVEGLPKAFKMCGW